MVSTRDCIFLAIGVIAAGTLVYVAYDKDETAQPRYDSEAVMTGFDAVMTVFDHLNTGDHYFHPGYVTEGQQQIFTPHRYPAVSGGNITALIHQGFSGMSQPAPQDADWFEEPPGREIML
jgi:hypothetical protein